MEPSGAAMAGVISLAPGQAAQQVGAGAAADGAAGLHTLGELSDADLVAATRLQQRVEVAEAAEAALRGETATDTAPATDTAAAPSDAPLGMAAAEAEASTAGPAAACKPVEKNAEMAISNMPTLAARLYREAIALPVDNLRQLVEQLSNHVQSQLGGGSLEKSDPAGISPGR
jgi:hypothetical protein